MPAEYNKLAPGASLRQPSLICCCWCCCVGSSSGSPSHHLPSGMGNIAFWTSANSVIRYRDRQAAWDRPLTITKGWRLQTFRLPLTISRPAESSAVQVGFIGEPSTRFDRHWRFPAPGAMAAGNGHHRRIPVFVECQFNSHGARGSPTYRALPRWVAWYHIQPPAGTATSWKWRRASHCSQGLVRYGFDP